MTGQDFLKKNGVSKTAIFLSCLSATEVSYVNADTGVEYMRGPSNKALMFCCGKWAESQTTNSQLETTPSIASIESIRIALKKERMENGHTCQYSLLGSPVNGSEVKR